MVKGKTENFEYQLSGSGRSGYAKDKRNETMLPKDFENLETALAYRTDMRLPNLNNSKLQ